MFTLQNKTGTRQVPQHLGALQSLWWFSTHRPASALPRSIMESGEYAHTFIYRGWHWRWLLSVRPEQNRGEVRILNHPADWRLLQLLVRQLTFQRPKSALRQTYLGESSHAKDGFCSDFPALFCVGKRWRETSSLFPSSKLRVSCFGLWNKGCKFPGCDLPLK